LPTRPELARGFSVDATSQGHVPLGKNGMEVPPINGFDMVVYKQLHEPIEQEIQAFRSALRGL
jgi:hypothetical protein